MTELEYKNKYNTSNLFNLPLYYNYGLGSYGINCWRELLMHIKTTNYVLSGQCINFPLLYHYRVIETEPKKIKFDNIVKVIIIPNINEILQNELLDELWWTSYDLQNLHLDNTILSLF